MSMKLTALAMDVKVGNPLRKLVLLKLCDNANDQGECWPSMQHIADQCEISRRSVATHINALVEAGFLRVINRGKGGKKTSNMYAIDLTPRPADEDGAEVVSEPVRCAGDAHLSSAGSSAGAAHGCAGAAHLSSAGAAHRTSHSFEPVIEPKKNNIKKIEQDFSGWPAVPSADVWTDYKKLRRSKRAPLTATVMRSIGVELVRLASFGIGVDQALRVCCERGWQGMRAEWVVNHLESRALSSGGGYRSARERDAQRFADALDYGNATKF